MRKCLGWTILVAAVATSGCATLFAEDRRPVVMNSAPDGATVYVNGAQVGMTPITVDLDNSENHVIRFTQEGREDAFCRLNASVGTKWLILDVLFGLVPLVVDAVTGDWKELDDDACHGVLIESGEIVLTNPWDQG